MTAKKERIGEFLVRTGALTQNQVNEVLNKKQEQPDRLFGDIALELGYINNEIIDKFLKKNED